MLSATEATALSPLWDAFSSVVEEPDGGSVLWRAGDYLLQLEWVGAAGREEGVGSCTGASQPS